MQNFFNKYINVFLIYIFIKQKYAIFPTLRLILSVFKRIIILTIKLDLNSKFNLFWTKNYTQFLQFIISKKLLEYIKLLNYKYYKTSLEYKLNVYKKRIKIFIKFAYIKTKKNFFIIFVKKVYIFINYFLITIILINILFIVVFSNLNIT